jgi:hypothetical protein
VTARPVDIEGASSSRNPFRHRPGCRSAVRIIQWRGRRDLRVFTIRRCSGAPSFAFWEESEV